MKKQLLAAIAAMAVLGYTGFITLHAQTGTKAPATSSNTTVAENNVNADLLAAQPPSLHEQTGSAAAPSTANMTVADLNKKVDDLTKKIESPDAIYYKGVTLSPSGSFVAAETVNRTTAAASGINTAFTGIPLNYSDASELSEFYGTGRQSRIALTGVGKLDNMTLTGHWEADWLTAGELEQ